MARRNLLSCLSKQNGLHFSLPHLQFIPANGSGCSCRSFASKRAMPDGSNVRWDALSESFAKLDKVWPKHIPLPTMRVDMPPKPFDRSLDVVTDSLFQKDGSFQMLNHPMILTNTDVYMSSRLWNNRCSRIYKRNVEKRYKESSLLGCANEIYLMLTSAVSNKDFTQSSALLEPLQNRRFMTVVNSMSDEQRALFRFTADDLYWSFLYLVDKRIVGGNQYLNGHLFNFHTCAWLVRDLKSIADEHYDGQMPSLGQLRRNHRQNIIIGNVTLSRQTHYGKFEGSYDLTDPQPWFVTVFNFFQHPSKVTILL